MVLEYIFKVEGGILSRFSCFVPKTHVRSKQLYRVIDLCLLPVGIRQIGFMEYISELRKSYYGLCLRC
jgi:hypothetical protein